MCPDSWAETVSAWSVHSREQHPLGCRPDTQRTNRREARKWARSCSWLIPLKPSQSTTPKLPRSCEGTQKHRQHSRSASSQQPATSSSIGCERSSSVRYWWLENELAVGHGLHWHEMHPRHFSCRMTNTEGHPGNKHNIIFRVCEQTYTPNVVSIDTGNQHFPLVVIQEQTADHCSKWGVDLRVCCSASLSQNAEPARRNFRDEDEFSSRSRRLQIFKTAKKGWKFNATRTPTATGREGSLRRFCVHYAQVEPRSHF